MNGNYSEDLTRVAGDVRGSGAPPSTARRVSPVERWVLGRLLRAMGDPPVTIVFPNGEKISPTHRKATSRVVFRTRRALWKLSLNPVFQFPESYANGEIDVEGLDALLTSVFRQFNHNQAYGTRFDRMLHWFCVPHGNTRTGSACRMAIRVTNLAATFTTITTWVMISIGCGSIDDCSTRARITNSLH
jgi:hypothetical protein